ncbi:MAG: hypothetical protein M0009_02690, partial [Deltaproteobacteria bacterium]|nr:hypothetical protein [Deltaproteobacteria bacterium]
RSLYIKGTSPCQRKSGKDATTTGARYRTGRFPASLSPLGVFFPRGIYRLDNLGRIGYHFVSLGIGYRFPGKSEGPQETNCCNYLFDKGIDME